MTRTAGAQIGCQRPSRFWGLGCPKIYHEAEDTLAGIIARRYLAAGRATVLHPFLLFHMYRDFTL
ncbi:hypothetical protein [Thiolapillus sp.]|uniref:hypothetical protein n=1 Tax=Thiolapillus sp. TaxID=2017437 RepID=UPI0025D48356|nr:hypothetical protein [Thiolapillus sp.]